MTAETELAPLARVIANTLRDTPIRIGAPDTVPELVGALTVAVAAYIGREVLPPGALDTTRPMETTWTVEAQRRSTGQWVPHSRTYDNRAEAMEQQVYALANHPQWPYRVVRATTIYTIEQPPADTITEPR